jgi:UDP-N-acetyl-D-mannosaminuronate dehydrogenase
MESIVSIVLVTTIFYIVVKTIDMKYVKKELKPLKEMMRDAAVVSISSGIAVFSVMTLNKPVGGFFDAITEKTAIPAAANVFTGDPGF